MLCISFIRCQNFNNRSLDITDNVKVIQQPESFIVEKEIDPKNYILGPADKVGLSIIATSHFTYILTVTPSGELWLPDIGVIRVSGISIPEAQIKIQKYIQENKYNDAEVTLVLLNIRNFKVQVIGAVTSPGFINISSISRLTDIVHRAGGLHKLANEEQISIDRNGINTNYSLKSYQLNGNLENNPSLQEGDIVYIPYLDSISKEVKSLISHKNSLVLVTGFVKKPGAHKFLPGYTIMDYIGLSGGIADMGSSKTITLYRNGKDADVSTSDYIQPGDQIYISANMKYRYLGNISILQIMTAIMSLYLTFVAATN